MDVNLGENTKTYGNIVRAIVESRRRGEFTFHEMELHAVKGISMKPILSELIQMRFPIIFIDEAQDTKKKYGNY